MNNEIFFKVLWASKMTRNLSIFLIKNTFEFQPRLVAVLIANIDFDYEIFNDRDWKFVSLLTFLETPEANNFCLIFINRTLKEVLFAIRLISLNPLNFTVLIDKLTLNFKLANQIFSLPLNWTVCINFKTWKIHKVLCTLLLLITLPINCLFQDLTIYNEFTPNIITSFSLDSLINNF